MGQADILEAAHKAYGGDQVQGEVINTLRLGNDSLLDLVDEFMKTRSQPNRAQIACFYELKVSDVGVIMGKQEIIVCWFCSCIYTQTNYHHSDSS